MTPKKRILLKLTGEVFLSADKHHLDDVLLRKVIAQIKQLHPQYHFGIVVGGGNLFRGSLQGKQLGMTPTSGHQVGMLATMMNGIIVKDLIEQAGLATTLFCAVPCPEVGVSISQQYINNALAQDHILIFTGGTGNPFFTTDTNAIIRGLQIEAFQVWKGTNVDGIYDADPRTTPNAQLLKQTTYKEVLAKQLRIMDAAAFALAQHYRQVIRIFNILKDDALLQAAHNDSFGSTIFTEIKGLT